MKGIGRNLCFWNEILQKMMLTMVLTVIGILAVMTFLNGGDFMEEFGKSLPSFLMMIAFLTVFMNALNGMSNYFPMTVSLGSTRKQSYIAMQIIQHMIMAELIILIYLCSHFLTAEMYRGFFVSYPMTFVGLNFLMVGVGELISAVCIRFGRTKGLIVYVVIILVAAGGVGIGFANGFDFNVSGSSLKQLLSAPWILLLGIAVDLVMMLVLYLQIRKDNLQFT